MPTPGLHLLPDLAAVALCAVATVTDLRSYRIPNWLTGAGILLGLGLNAAAFTALGGLSAGLRVGLGGAALGGAACLVGFGLLGAVRAVGMGDVKLMAAVGALLRFPLALEAMVYALLAGGLLSLVYAIARGRLAAVLRNVFRLASREEGVRLHRIPFALAIFLGCLAAVLAREHPFLSLF